MFPFNLYDIVRINLRRTGIGRDAQGLIKLGAEPILIVLYTDTGGGTGNMTRHRCPIGLSYRSSAHGSSTDTVEAGQQSSFESTVSGMQRINEQRPTLSLTINGKGFRALLDRMWQLSKRSGTSPHDVFPDTQMLQSTRKAFTLFISDTWGYARL
ncbi:hypothetical protein NECAME_13563 [Necator americanus]|uniref:Uncharacterized protein n=1 Tax=Necator americanus TaxID=51031 RepID=W2SUU3_NECAM|nr:hypothetical protein NECAME_13563 [Necator americanus]ETN73268.1 hypothetical protein NECAME_13563 [Necator americanus]